MRSFYGLAALVFLGGIAFGFLGGEYSTPDYWQIKRELAQESTLVEQLRLEIDSLRTTAELIENDSATLERIAREDLGMIRNGETLVRFN